MCIARLCYRHAEAQLLRPSTSNIGWMPKAARARPVPSSAEVAKAHRACQTCRASGTPCQPCQFTALYKIGAKPTTYCRQQHTCARRATFRLYFLEAFSNQVAKENQKDRDDSLQDDGYGPSGSGITVRDACIYPCGGANCHGGSQNINH